ncbi:hypothetical protein CDL15_Pgr001940 [Punica granatum]|nr:hypothetical protein CDL15_Pgr001940 [Punica granatum]
MEIKEAERTVVAKPVASRPSSSSFRSFSELLAGAIDASPSNPGNEMAVTAIRPKTVRFKSTVNRAPPPPALVVASGQAETLGTATYNSAKDATMKSDSRRTVVYKPLAKVVSKSTVSLLANMGNFNVAHQQGPAPPETRVRNQTVEKTSSRSQYSLNPQQPIPPPAEHSQTISEPTKVDDPKILSSSANVDRPSYDGYNWRKYGQKQVKGSEYPRSYYKCTHPNCPVKKKVERSFDGQIAEIVYKGEHNHPKPQPPKRSSSGPQEVGTTTQEAAKPNVQVEERNEGLDVRIENNQDSEKGVLAQTNSYRGKGLQGKDPAGIWIVSNNARTGTPDNSCGLSGECEDGSKGMEVEDDEPRSKRRKSENPSAEAGISADGTQESRVVVQNSAEPEIVGDGFRWRKYGQKVVKGNPYPRSYYRCTSLKCNVRKHVERVSDDPGAFITTYEGRHNHEMPLRGSNAAGLEQDPQAATSKDNP